MPGGYPAPVLDPTVISKVLAHAVDKGADHAEIFVEDRDSTGLRLEDRRVEDVASGRDGGAGVRIISGDKVAYAYTNVLAEASLIEAAEAARAGLSTSGSGTTQDLRSVSPAVVHPVSRPPLEV